MSTPRRAHALGVMQSALKVRKSLTDRWHAQAMELLDEILSVSDVMGVEK